MCVRFMIVGDRSFQNHLNWVEEISAYIEKTTVDFYNDGKSAKELDDYLKGTYKLLDGLEEDIHCYLNRGLDAL